MANTKISAEPAASTLTGAELILGVQGGSNVQVTAAQMANLAASSTYIGSSRLQDIYEFFRGSPTSSSKVLRLPMSRAVSFPANFSGAYAISSVAATASAAFDVQKNGSSIGTVTFAAGATSATFVTASASAQSLIAGDVLSIIAPAAVDATLIDIGFSIPATFSYAPILSGADPYFSNVVLLAHFNGSNGQTATIDSSSRGRTLVAANGASLSTAQSKFGISSSLCNGDTKTFFLPNYSDWWFSNGQFTVECWANFSVAPGSAEHAILSQWDSPPGAQGWWFGMSGGSLSFYYSITGTGATQVGSALVPALGVWHHVAVDRDSSGMLRVYFNGTVVASALVTSTFVNSPTALNQNGTAGSGNGIYGYTGESRITKGVGRYGGAFTPPTAAFPNY